MDPSDTVANALFVRFGTSFTSLNWDSLPEQDRQFWRVEARLITRRVLRAEARKKELNDDASDR